MALQLPLEVRGIAAGVLLFSFAGLICSALVVWLTWSHRERTSCMFLSLKWGSEYGETLRYSCADSFALVDIALIGYLLLASTASAVATQLHTFIAWEDVATAQWMEAVANPKNPEQIISNGAVGFDLALWYFRMSHHLPFNINRSR